MRESQTQARVSLCAAYSAPYANSVGALTGLDGEVTIADGQAWVTRNMGDRPVTSRPFCADGDRATLLSVGHMSGSIRFALAASADIHAPERAIHDASENYKCFSLNGPIVFTITGSTNSYKVLVITCECAYATADVDSLRLEITSATHVMDVDFYAEGQAGVLTHH